MDGFRALRITDKVFCTCDPRCKGNVVQGSNKTFINSLGAARVGDRTTNCCGCRRCPCPNFIMKGSSKTFIDNRPAARKGDPIRVGFALTASANTFIGG